MASGLPFVGIKSAYENIVEQITGTGYVKWCDIDFGQGMSRDTVPAIEYPAALLKFDNVIWQGRTDDGAGIRGVVTLNVKLICQILTEEDWLIPMHARHEVYGFYDLLGQLHLVVQDLHTDNFSGLKLFNQYHINTPLKEMLWTEVLQYRCNIQTNGGLDHPDELVIDFDKARDDNDVLERKEYNLMNR